MLQKFLLWLDGRLPYAHTVKEYLSQLRYQKKSHATLSQALTVIKHFTDALSSQAIDINTSEREYRRLAEDRASISNVHKLKAPPREIRSNKATIDQLERRSKEEMLTIFNSIEKDTLQGKRDYALLVFMANSAIRVSEASRITLKNFVRYSDDTALIVGSRGKNNNYDEVPIPLYVYRVIEDYVNSYNAALPKRDPRRIQGEQPIWMPLTRSGNIFKGVKEPMNRYGISSIIKRRTTEAGYPMKPHDFRRFLIAYLRSIEMDHDDIRKVSRHASLDMVVRYVGKQTNYDKYNHYHRTKIELL